MPVILVGQDQIPRMFVIELVDLVPAIEHRQVPFEQIDEDGFARGEHRAKCPILAAIQSAINKLNHVANPSMLERGTGFRLGGSTDIPRNGDSVSASECP